MSGADEEFMGRWSPAVPEPYWIKRWFRWKPSCLDCWNRYGPLLVFADRDEWVRHWAQHHMESER